MKKNIGLYFGSFNPIHVGHLILANHMVEHTNLDEIWLVVTPHNPLKKRKTLLDDHQRLELVFLATKNYPKLSPSAIEFQLSQPNYTVHTLAHLVEKYPDYEFGLIMGEDNLKSFHKWKNYETILENHQLYVYPRISNEVMKHQFENHEKITRVPGPIVAISATQVRKGIKEGKNIQPLLPAAVWEYIDEMNFYKK